MTAEPQDRVVCPAGYEIRPRREEDDPALLVVENRATELFRDHGYPGLADEPLADVAAFRAMAHGRDVWVATAGDEPVGYAVAGSLDPFFHLRELAVDPAHGRRGLGTALVRVVVAVAAHKAFDGVSLTTFRAVPFNAPFYARLGFRGLTPENAPRVLREAFASEVPPGVDPSERVLMVRCPLYLPAET